LSEIWNTFALAEKQDRKARQRLAFLPVSKAHTNEFNIFRQCTKCMYISLYAPCGPKIYKNKILDSWFYIVCILYNIYTLYIVKL
jgi:hypothetical protein